MYFWRCGEVHQLFVYSGLSLMEDHEPNHQTESCICRRSDISLSTRRSAEFLTMMWALTHITYMCTHTHFIEVSSLEVGSRNVLQMMSNLQEKIDKMWMWNEAQDQHLQPLVLSSRCFTCHADVLLRSQCSICILLCIAIYSHSGIAVRITCLPCHLLNLWPIDYTSRWLWSQSRPQRSCDIWLQAHWWGHDGLHASERQLQWNVVLNARTEPQDLYWLSPDKSW